MLVKFINFLNVKPKLNFKLAHLYKFKRYNCRQAASAGQGPRRYNKNSLISPNYFRHVSLKQTLDAGLIHTLILRIRIPGRKKGIFFISPQAKAFDAFAFNKSFSINYSILSSTAGSKVSCSTDSFEREMKNFYAWFSGFTDAEGSFYIAKSKICSFRFQINLHKDDLNVLYYIHKSLGFGEVRLYNNYGSFTVTRLKDIAQLINIFDKYPLQGSKWLNYRDFVLAFELYTNSNPSSDVLNEIAKLKNNMNRLRLDYTIPKDKVINITPYWFLGFIEGEGCFSINKHNNYRLDFSLTQSSTNFELMKSIKVYLENLPSTEGDYTNAIGISEVRSKNPNHESVTRIETTRILFISDVFIPFLDSLTWQSKKYLDYLDWKNILKLKEQGMLEKKVK
uniref:hypothetical protein n=1 Tax=Dematophora necatrix TaxID=2751867 RepID=UPI0030E08C31